MAVMKKREIKGSGSGEKEPSRKKLVHAKAQRRRFGQYAERKEGHRG